MKESLVLQNSKTRRYQGNGNLSDSAKLSGDVVLVTECSSS